MRPHISNQAYGASVAFAREWRAHRMLAWLNKHIWQLRPHPFELLGLKVMMPGGGGRLYKRQTDQ